MIGEEWLIRCSYFGERLQVSLVHLVDNTSVRQED